MNKKFLVVALMAALSTVGYAYSSVKDTGDGPDYTTLNKNFTEVQKDVNNINQALNQKADSSTIKEMQGQIDDNTNRVGKVEKELDNKVSSEKYRQDGLKVQTKLDDLDQATKATDARLDQIVELNKKAHQEHSDAIKKNESAIENLEEKVKTELGANKVKDQAQDNRLNMVEEKNADQEAAIKENTAAIEKETEDRKKEDAAIREEIKNNKEAQDKVNADQEVAIKENTAAIEKETEDRIAADEKLAAQIDKFQGQMDKYEGRLSGLEKKVDHLDDKMNKGLSLMAAMNAVDFQSVQTGEMAIGAGVGHYGNAQSVALGVAYSPVEDLTVNAKYSVTAGDADSFAVGAGATYKFKVGR